MSENDDLLFDRFRQWMESHRVVPNPGVSSETLDGLERQNGWKFPEDVRRCLAKVNGCTYGFARGDRYEFHWDFYPVSEWATKNGEYFGRPDWMRHGCVMFGDHMIEAPACGICLAPDSPLWGRVVLFLYFTPEDYLAGSQSEHDRSFSESVRVIVDSNGDDFP